MTAPRKPSKPSKRSTTKAASRKLRAPKLGPVAQATADEIKALPAVLGKSAVAAAALAMAREIDNTGNSATSKSMCAARLVEAMDKLRGQVPDQPTKTKLDEIAKRREQRIARRAAS